VLTQAMPTGASPTRRVVVRVLVEPEITEVVLEYSLFTKTVSWVESRASSNGTTPTPRYFATVFEVVFTIVTFPGSFAGFVRG